MEETIALIKSCIISKKSGVPIENLNDEFRNLVGEPIPYRRLGFSNLRAFLRTVKNLRITWNEFGEQALMIKDSKISHLNKLIRKPKVDYTKTKNKYYKQFTHCKSSSDYNDERKRSIQFNNNCNARRMQHFNQRHKSNFNNEYICRNRNSFQIGKENHHPVVIETNDIKRENNIYGPIANGQQLIGDDFFLQLAIRNLYLPIWRYRDSLALHCGLCVSGQTISDCTRTLRKIDTISNRVIILLGSVDVYNSATCDEMIDDMTELLQVLRSKFHLSNSAITICTIPPLANVAVCVHRKQNLALFCFNNWVRSLADDASRRDPSFENYPIIDLFESFCNKTYSTNYDWFQTQARRVSDTKHSYVLWNDKGRKQAMSLICEEEEMIRCGSLNSSSMS
ncbi:hypothetical protein HN011_004449 [Eciton burchellii]|nr:hypothetical protein HN011_004449 [Eciton burchellii]